MALESLAIPLDGYDSSLHGMKLGTTVWAYGKRFRLVEVHTTLASTELTQYSPVVYQDTAFTITDDVSEGLWRTTRLRRGSSWPRGSRSRQAV